MTAVLERRCLEGGMASRRHPPLDSSHTAALEDIVAFLNGGVDVRRMIELALPLSCVCHRPLTASVDRKRSAPVALPAAYAVMKLTLLPDRFSCPAFGIADTDVWMEPAMIALLRAGRVRDAYQVALRRLRAAGLPPTLSNTPGIPDRSEPARRLAAALLFPTGTAAYTALAELALRRPLQGVATGASPAGQPDQ